MKEVYIVGAQRTPIGSFGGILSSFSATQLGGFVVKALIDQTKIDSAQIKEIIKIKDKTVRCVVVTCS